MKLSAVILTLNEEKVIKDCLESVCKWVDEIVVVDSCSTDRTKEIAKKYTEKIFTYKLASFAKQREFGADKAGGDWILYLDADERVNKDLRFEIEKEIERNQCSAYRMPRQNYFYGNKIRFGGYWPDYVTRLFKKKNLLGWQGKIHESAKFKGELGRLDSPLVHLGHRSVSDGFAKSLVWTKMEAELFYKAGHPKVTALRVLKVGLWEFCFRYIKKQGFRDGFIGFMEAIIQAWNRLMVYIQLWELQEKELRR